MKELEEKYKDIAQLEEIREKVKKLKKELVWAHVRDKRVVSLIFLNRNQDGSFCSVALKCAGLSIPGHFINIIFSWCTSYSYIDCIKQLDL